MSKSSTGSNGRSVPTTQSAAARAQGAVARANGGGVPAGNYAGRLQVAAARNAGKSGNK